MDAPANLSTIDQLRARDGDKCWLCDGKLSFNAQPGSKNAPTKEHLQARCNGGGDTLDNLVLCHAGCNRKLGTRPKADKLAMRNKEMVGRTKIAAPVKSVSKPLATKPSPNLVVAKPLATKPSPNLVVAKPLAIKPLPKQVVAKPPVQASAPNWQRIAMIATATATFFAGLCLGMLIT